MGKAFDRVVDSFHAHNLKVRMLGEGKATAQAPGHSNADQSVSITDVGGRVLVWSHSDPTDSVLEVLGLSKPDLFDEAKGVTYDYPDGRKVSRTPFKKFSQAGNTKGDQLYRADKIADSPIVFVVEGEQDVHALESIGVSATCTAMGAGKAHLFDLSPLRGKRVLIVRDMDDAGLAHANQIAELLKGIATVNILEPAVGKDAADHIASGLGVDDFTDLVVADPRFETAVNDQRFSEQVRAEAKRREADAKASITSDTLTPKPLGDILGAEATFDWLVPGLFERKDRLIVTGGEGAGKSWLMRQLAICMAAGVHPFNMAAPITPLRVLVIDAENTEQQWSRGAQYVTDVSERAGRGNPRQDVMVAAGIRLDLTTSQDVNQVHKLIDRHNPDVLYIGPLYKLAPKAITSDDDAAPLIVALDGFRDRGLLLLMEAHAGHAKALGGERDLRPRGSAALLGWPEFGFGLSLIDGDESMATFTPWRGGREMRDWPHRLRKGLGGELPWMPAW